MKLDPLPLVCAACRVFAADRGQNLITAGNQVVGNDCVGTKLSRLFLRLAAGCGLHNDLLDLNPSFYALRLTAADCRFQPVAGKPAICADRLGMVQIENQIAALEVSCAPQEESYGAVMLTVYSSIPFKALSG